MTQSQTVIGAVPGAADAWTDVGTINVPAGVKRLAKIRASIAPDTGALAQVHCMPVIRLMGAGLLEQNPHEYVLQGCTLSITAANSGSVTVEPEIMEYDVSIPVSVGGSITVQINMVNEIPAAMTSRVELDFDEQDATDKNSMSHYVEATPPAAAGAWVAVGTLRVPQSSEGNSPTAIKEIVCGRVADVAGNVLIRNSARFRLSGSGLKEGGTHEFISTGSGVMWTTPGGQGYDRAIKRIKRHLEVNAGGDILVESIADVEIPEGGTDILAVHYE